jgi:hypothetical protein
MAKISSKIKSKICDKTAEKKEIAGYKVYAI